MAVSNFVLIHLIDVEIFYKVSKIFVLLVTLEEKSGDYQSQFILLAP